MSRVLVVLALALGCVKASPFKYLHGNSHDSASLTHSHHQHHAHTAATASVADTGKFEEEAHDFRDDESAELLKDPRKLTDKLKLSREWISTHVYESSSGRPALPNNVFEFRPSTAADRGTLKGRDDLDREYRFEEAPFNTDTLRLRNARYDGMKCSALATCSCIHYFFRIPGDNVVLQASYHANAGAILREGRPIQLIHEPALAKATRKNTFVVIQVGPSSRIRIGSENIYYAADLFSLVEVAKIPLDNIYVITGDSLSISYADKDGFISHVPPQVQAQVQPIAPQEQQERMFLLRPPIYMPAPRPAPVVSVPKKKKKKGLFSWFVQHITCSKHLPDEDCDE